MPIASSIGAPGRGDLDVDRPDAKTTRFLRYYREVAGRGTMDEALITVA